MRVTPKLGPEQLCTYDDILNELIDQLLDPFLFFPQDKYLRHQKRSVRPPGLLAQRIGDNCDGRSPGSWIFTDIRLPA